MAIIDISQPLNGETPIYPGDEPLILYEQQTVERDGYSTFFLSSNLHAGTHLDVPMHLIKDERTVADFPLEQFMGEGVLLDVRGEAVIDYQVAYEELIQPQAIVLLYTGHDTFYYQSDYFTDHPTVSEELADFFVRKEIKMLGMDMPSPDYHPFEIHQRLFQADIPLLENLTNLEKLLAVNNFQVMALPLKIEAEASFVRAVCLT
ncbi:cyclase family protein [Vagococcus elongatus]|uniref:Cyclase n=1 Tax=Vagococcus elongatus TaxID=180344 RepID=A0A430B1U3_9ENTE|nr:cyclase family protein [Vagococcus elongatus]RSU14290.1 cyclase [Vagococcus elongatus]